MVVTMQRVLYSTHIGHWGQFLQFHKYEGRQLPANQLSKAMNGIVRNYSQNGVYSLDGRGLAGDVSFTEVRGSMEDERIGSRRKEISSGERVLLVESEKPESLEEFVTKNGLSNPRKVLPVLERPTLF